MRRIKLTVCELAYEISVDSPSFYLYEWRIRSRIGKESRIRPRIRKESRIRPRIRKNRESGRELAKTQESGPESEKNRESVRILTGIKNDSWAVHPFWELRTPRSEWLRRYLFEISCRSIKEKKRVVISNLECRDEIARLLGLSAVSVVIKTNIATISSIPFHVNSSVLLCPSAGRYPAQFA